MLASRVDMLAGTRGHRYFVERQLKCLKRNDYLCWMHFVEAQLRCFRRQCNAIWRMVKNGRDLRHRLVDGFNPVSQGKLINNLLVWLFKVNFPALLSLRVG